ncbi:restriction endonuclease [Paenibacillus sp. Soil750]|uniref:restriction endonuclease n=1 Tax=Paenibacillus sp. Soil750 TaxID=1736398 RepID=UPI0006F68941|nr:restriction endonuclease [Paenibacillus sp. Soil750]KRE70881.1 endonuclease [Paenibacillus sp. Soil750]
MLGLILIVILILILLVIVVGILAYRKSSSQKQQEQFFQIDDYDLKKINIEDIDRMLDGSEFEMYLYRLFLELGYSGVYKTVGSRDFGADLIFTDSEGVRNVVQAKRYGIDNPVGLSAVQEVFTSMRYYKARKSIVVATTKYTDSCETLAGINHVKLLDRNDLIRIIEAFKQDDNIHARDIIESEPRVILESWNQMNNALPVIKKDHKAEKYVKSIQSK